MINAFDSIPRFKNRTETCADHGEFIASNWVKDLWTSCPKCGEEQRKREEQRYREETAKRMAEEAAAAKQRDLEARLGCSGIPPRFRTRTIEGFKAETPEQIQARKFALEYAQEFDNIAKTGRSAIFVGGTGTGKTHLAAAIGMTAINTGHTVTFGTVQRVIRYVKRTWSKDSQLSEAQAIETFTDVDLLILDEVGVQFGSVTEENILFDIINRRYEQMRPTIYLSNLDLDGVRQYLGERSFDRIREDGGRCIAFDWPSYRGSDHASTE